MKKNQTTKAAFAQKPANETPKYHLAEVPQHLRVRLLDLCFRRLYYDAMKLLEVHGFNHYSQDDLLNFYNWAPTELPGVSEVGRGVPAEPPLPRDYDQPAQEQLDELRQRLTAVPTDVLQRVHDVLKQDSIAAAASLLWKAGVCFSSAELYEYRKTLFPPNAMVDAYTSGPPTLRAEQSGLMDSGINGLVGSDSSSDGSSALCIASASPPKPDNMIPAGQATRVNAVPQERANPKIQESINPTTQQFPDPVDEGQLTTDHGLPITDTDSQAINPPIHESHNPALLPSLPEEERQTDGLTEARQRLVLILAARSADAHVGVEGPLATDKSINPSIQQSTNPSSNNPPIPKSINPSALLSDLRDLITRYVVLPEMAAETLALWVVHTYAFTLRQVTTYIGVVSPEKRCGKTTLLELLGLLAHEAIAAANISPPALFRVIEEKRPTLIIDEADTFLQGRDEMAGILNAGYRKSNAYVVRVENKPRRKPASSTPSVAASRESAADSTQLAQYSCWCPKVMAAIGRLPDTLSDRCIVITMQRKMPTEKCERLRNLDATDYRQRCADFVRENSDAIADAQPDIPATLNDRAADIWEPLFAIADLAGGDWPALARQAAQKLSAAYDDEVSLIGHFLFDVRNWLHVRKTDRMLSRELVACMNALPERPWKDLCRGRDINEYWLGRKMTELGINSKCIRIAQTVGKGYLLADIEAAFRRYVPNPDLHSAKPPNSS